MSAAGDGVPKIMTFRPEWDKFKDFNSFVLHMEELGAHKAGIALIKTPEEFKPCPAGYDHVKIGEIKLPPPFIQTFKVVKEVHGAYYLPDDGKRFIKKPTTVKQFKAWANSPKYARPAHIVDTEAINREYWRTIYTNAPIYGADVPHSLTDPSVTEW